MMWYLSSPKEPVSLEKLVATLSSKLHYELHCHNIHYRLLIFWHSLEESGTLICPPHHMLFMGYRHGIVLVIALLN